MYFENVVVDATDPQLLGRFWEAALGTTTLTDEDAGFETRLTVPDGPVLDLCFQRVPTRPTEPQRLHLDLRSAGDQQEIVDRLLGLGAAHADIGQGDVPWVVLTDPEGNPFCVLEERATYADTGPLAAVVVHSADPDRDCAFWAWLTGWVLVDGGELPSLRHPSGRGPRVEFLPEPASKGPEEGPEKGPDKNRMHLDVRLESGDDADAVAQAIAERGGRELHFDWGDLPWRHYADPSGNEFCVLPASH